MAHPTAQMIKIRCGEKNYPRKGADLKANSMRRRTSSKKSMTVETSSLFTRIPSCPFQTLLAIRTSKCIRTPKSMTRLSWKGCKSRQSSTSLAKLHVAIASSSCLKIVSPCRWLMLSTKYKSARITDPELENALPKLKELVQLSPNWQLQWAIRSRSWSVKIHLKSQGTGPVPGSRHLTDSRNAQ